MARADIQADIDLDSSGFRKGIKKSQRSVKNFVDGAIKQFGLLAGAAGIGSLTRSAINLGSYLSDVAESTGFATEQFQVFRGALIDAGGNAESMEKAILLMQKAVVQGSEGLTTYKRAFERLGLSVDQLKSMRPEQQFEMIAKSIASAEDQQEALTAAIEIFGQRNAPRLIEVFKRLDKDGYGKMAKDIEKAYGLMDTETQKKLDAASDRIDRFKNKVTIMTGTVLTYVVPSFTILKEALGKVGDIVGSLIGKFSSLLGFMGRSVKVTIDPVIKQFQSLAMGIKGVSLAFTNPIKAAEAFSDSLALQKESFQSLVDVPSKLAKEYARANEEMEIDSAHLEQSMIERSENITNAWNDMWSDNVQTAKDANAEIVANTEAAAAGIKEETFGKSRLDKRKDYMSQTEIDTLEAQKKTWTGPKNLFESRFETAPISPAQSAMVGGITADEKRAASMGDSKQEKEAAENQLESIKEIERIITKLDNALQ